jgi:hypothetical protein
MKSQTVVVASLSLIFCLRAVPQQRTASPSPAQALKTPKEAAPIDLTGNWVSVVTEDWRWRMLIPKKGDYSSVPLSPEGRKLADTWDQSQLAADGCKPYGAAAIMRVPGRLQITWQNDSTLRIDTDAGQQTRFFYFDETRKPLAERTWQGDSTAEWDRIAQSGGLGVSLQHGPGIPGALKVRTKNLKAGYLRRNGVPYSEETTMTEYFDRLTAYGTDWLIVFTIVEDPHYLNQPFVTSTHFKREPDRLKWRPVPCEPKPGQPFAVPTSIR